MICPKCGSSVTSEDYLCPECGFELKDADFINTKEEENQKSEILLSSNSDVQTPSKEETIKPFEAVKEVKKLNVQKSVTDSDSLKEALTDMFGEVNASPVESDSTLPSMDDIRHNIQKSEETGPENKTEETQKRFTVLRLIITCIFIIFSINYLYDAPTYTTASEIFYWVSFALTITAFLIGLYSLTNIRKKILSYLALTFSLASLLLSLFLPREPVIANPNRRDNNNKEQVVQYQITDQYHL